MTGIRQPALIVPAQRSTQPKTLRILIRHAISTGSLNDDQAPGVNRPKIHRIRSSKDRIENPISDHGLMRDARREQRKERSFGLPVI